MMKMSAESLVTAAAETGKSLPPVTVSASILAGITLPLQNIVLALTVIWLLCQIGGWIYDRFFRKHKHENQSD